MAHQEGWIEAYQLLEDGETIPEDLLKTIKSNKNDLGETILHWYAIEGERKIVEKIIKLGFDVNTQNEFGNTPLMECALIGRWEIVELLLEYGADPYISNEENENAIEYLGDNYKEKSADKLRQIMDAMTQDNHKRNAACDTRNHH